jgi:hypothetical protein
MNVRRTPKPIVNAHPPDQRPQFCMDWWPASRGARFPAPVAAKPGAMPAHKCFASVIDPVGAGFVASLARPGGNATGFALFEYGLRGKWLALLKEIAPSLTQAAVLREPATAAGTGQLGAIQAIAPSLGMELRGLPCAMPTTSSAALLRACLLVAGRWRCAAAAASRRATQQPASAMSLPR